MNLKKALAVVLSLASAIAVISLVQYINSQLYPPPYGFTTDMDANLMLEYINSLPLSAFLIVLLGYVLGAFVCGIVVKLLKRDMPNLYLMPTTILTVFGIINLMTIPHPMWFAVASTLSYITFGYLGAQLIKTKQS